MRFKPLRTLVAFALILFLCLVTRIYWHSRSARPHLRSAAVNISNFELMSVVDITAEHNIFSEKSSIICCGSDRHSRCIHWSKDRKDVKNANLISMHVHEAPVDLSRLVTNHNQFTMIYVLESEANSPRCPAWEKCDFAMWYNLDRSFPAPATYFDPATYLRALLKPVTKPKTKDIVWMSSNCAALNGRKYIVSELMKYIHVDCIGGCLRNMKRYSHNLPQVDIYRHYKFVIVIENSNCEDYITEKFIQVILAGSVPIVAGAEGKPDYLRFAPRNSFVNVADFRSIRSLAQHLEEAITDDDTYFKRYFGYKSSNIKTNWSELAAPDLIRWCREEKFADEPFAKHLLAKESGENKYCKILNYLQSIKSLDEIIKRGKKPRPSVKEVCLPTGYWRSRFGI